MEIDQAFHEGLERVGITGESVCLIALSGGSDSVALLDLSHRASLKSPFSLSAARVVHGIRDVSVEDAENEFCRKLCRDRGVPFESLESESESPAEIAEALGCGPEQAARIFRHRILEKHRLALGADCLLFGHTVDDQRETVLMRILSGSGLEGLKGIPRRRGSIRRPMLDMSRNDLRSYLKSSGIPWMEDASNKEDIYRRNRIRNELIPLLDSIYPGWTGGLNSLRERSEESVTALEDMLERQLPLSDREGRGSSLKTAEWLRDDWEGASPYLKAMALWKGMNLQTSADDPDRRIPWSSVKDARRAVDARQSWNSQGYSLRSDDYRILLSSVSLDFQARLVLDSRDLAAGFRAELASLTIVAGYSLDRNGPGIPVKPEEWPLQLYLSGDETSLKCSLSSCSKGLLLQEKSIRASLLRENPLLITEKSSGYGLPDADDNIVYIYISKKEAGTDAR